MEKKYSNDCKLIGKRVKELRKQKGMTQEELAKRLGYKSKTSIAHIENGRDISRTKVIRLAEILETSPAYLFGWEDEKSIYIKSIIEKMNCLTVNQFLDVLDYIDHLLSK